MDATRMCQFLLELKLQAAELPHVVAGNWTWFFARVPSALNYCTISSQADSDCFYSSGGKLKNMILYRFLYLPKKSPWKIYFFMWIQDFYLCVCTRVCMCAHVCKSKVEERVLGGLLYHPLFVPLRQGFSLNLGLASGLTFLSLGWKP